MSRGTWAVWLVLLACGATALAAMFVVLPRWYAEAEPTVTEAEPPPQRAVPKIKATLFYVAEDGLRLVAVRRDVPFGEGPLAQARHLVEAQLETPPPPLASAVPAGVTLRAAYLDQAGRVYLDLSGEVTAAHWGGAQSEILTVYALVNAVTANLPAVTSVQILVDGREVDTLAGHVDLRRPLSRSAYWVEPSQTAATMPTPAERTAPPQAASRREGTPAGRADAPAIVR